MGRDPQDSCVLAFGDSFTRDSALPADISTYAVV